MAAGRVLESLSLRGGWQGWQANKKNVSTPRKRAIDGGVIGQMNPSDSSPLVDEHGNPIRKPQSDREVLAALIRSELAGAKDALRAANDAELRRIAEAQYQPKVKFWRNATFWSIVGAVGLILWAVIRIPDFIDQKTQEFFREKLVGTALTNTVETVISNRAAVLVDQRLAPLENRTVVLSNSILETKSALGTITGDISNKQTQLAEQQVAIRNQQHVQELLVGTKAGSLADYKELQSLARQSNNIGSVAQAATVDVELFFDSYRYRSYRSRIFVDSVSLKAIEIPVDQTVGFLTDQYWSQRETAMFRLGELKKMNTVLHICEALRRETNLFVISYGTKALNEITGQAFGPLAVEDVARWWEAHKDRSEFQSPYINTIQFLGWAIYLSPAYTEQAIGPLFRTIEAEPLAWQARCLRANCYISKGQFDLAEKDLTEVEKGIPNYRMLHFDKALLFAAQGKPDGFVDSLNRALELSPGLEQNVRTVFADQLLNDQRIRWPSTNTKTNSIPKPDSPAK